MTLEERIYREIVKETGIPLDKVRKICRSQVKLSKDVMEDKSVYSIIRLPYLGVFYPLENRIRKHESNS
jgi:hypothetical protein